MAVQRENYDPLKIERLKQYLQKQADAGQKRYYEIYVDILKVVPRTDNIDLFDTYEEFLNEDTQKIRVLLYFNPDNNRNDQYVFMLKQEPQEKSLNGTSSKEKEKDTVHIDLRHERDIMQYEQMLEREKWKYTELEREYNKLRDEHKDAEEYVERLEDQLTEFKNKKLHLGNVNLGELASVVLEGMVRRNPQMLVKLPGGEALAGIIEEDNKQKSMSPSAQPVSEVTFQKQGSESNITEEEKGYISFMRSLAEHFSEQEVMVLTRIIEKLQDDPDKLNTVAELLEIDTKEI